MRDPTQVRSINHPPRNLSTVRPASGHNLPLRNIQKLPPEILAESLLGSMTDDEIFGLTRQRELASVCRKWRDVVLSTPQFWNAVTNDAQVGDPFLIVPVKLRRFKDTLLTVKYTNEPTDPESGVWNLLQSTTSRWKEATLTLGFRNHGKLSSTLEQGTPNIRRLTLLSNTFPREVRLGPTPCLEELCLSRGVSLDIISGTTLSTLRRLTVKAIKSESLLFVNFLPTLAGCPLLEFLHLESIPLVGFKRVAHVADLYVTLPFLKILKLEQVDASIVSLLFRHLRVDGLEQLRVDCRDLYRDAMALLQAVSEPRHGSGLILPVLNCKDTSEVCLFVGEEWLTIEDETKRLSLNFGLNEGDIRNLADLLRPVYHYCAASTRRIGMFVCLDRMRSLKSLHFLCGAAPMVTRIHCEDREECGLSRCVLDGISQNGCQICSPGGRTPSNTFSRLSELRIYAFDGSIPSPECFRAVHVAYLSRQRIVQGGAASSGADPSEDLPDLKIFIEDKFVPPDLGSLDQDP